MTTKKKTTVTHDHAPAHAAEGTAAAPDAEAATKVEADAPPAPAIPAVLQPPPTASPPAASSITAQVQDVIAKISLIPVILGSLAEPAEPLTIEQRRSLPKMKAGAGEHIPTVLNLADHYKLVIPGGTTAEARADIQLAALLDTLEAKLTTMQVVVADAAAQARARTWDTSTVAYGFLKKLVKRIPALQTELNPMASFMARTHKDAPTVLRPTEARALARSRAAAKEKREKANAAGPPAVAPIPSPAPVVVAAPIVSGPAAPANGGGAGVPGANGQPSGTPVAPGNGAGHP